MAKDEFRDDSPFFDEEELNEEVEPEETDNSEVTEEPEGEDELLQKITEVEKKTNDVGALTKILADPDVRALLDAKEKGRKVRLVDDVPEAKNPEIPEPDLSDEDEYTRKNLKKVFDYVRASLDLHVKPLKDQLQKVNQYVESMEGGKVQEEIAAERKKHSDFDDFREDMVEINKKNPGLSVSELYYLSKARKTGGFDAPRPASTERPQKNTARPAVQEKKATLPGKKGFDALLTEALDNLDI